MTSMFILIIVALCVGVAAWLFFLWAVKSGQYDDMEGPKYRMLEEDEDEKDQKKENSVQKNANPKPS